MRTQFSQARWGIRSLSLVVSSTLKLHLVFRPQKLFIDARDGRLDSVRKGLKAAADFDLNEQDKKVTSCCFVWSSDSRLLNTLHALRRPDKRP